MKPAEKPVKIALIPIDSRPITFFFPQQVALSAGLDVIAPPLEMMGDLEVPADCEALFVWVDQCLSQFKPDLLVVCLDSLLYGGLVASRCSLDPLAEIQKRKDRISQWKRLSGGKTQIFAQSSIMRIPHYNTSTTEPPYWLEHGEKIFKWSALKHKQELKLELVDAEVSLLESEIPREAIADFLVRRERNFQINQALIEMAVSNELDYLVLSQDDTSDYGLNVLEKSRLLSKASALGAGNVVAYAGTDETILVLLSRWLVESGAKAPQVSFSFSSAKGASVLSNFEGQTIGKSVSDVAKLIGLSPISMEPRCDDDLKVIIHSPTRRQGDHLGAQLGERLDTSEAVRETTKLLEESQIPIVLCDVAYANGADPLLIEALFERPKLFEKLRGYAGWNTTNNSVGSALAMGVAWWYGRLNEIDRQEDIERALFVRFADDWAYQAIVRRELNGQASEALLKKLMAPLLKKLAKALGIDPNPVALSLPWKRTFEVKVDFEEPAKSANIVFKR